MAKKLVVVLGMHRSGTSTLTRGLDAMGISLGKRFLGNMPEVNARGFWEDKDLNAVNIELLMKLGTDWYENRLLRKEDLDGELIAPMIERTARLLQFKLQGVNAFAFKDPRTAILLPFWKRVFSQLDAEVQYVIATRNPLSVAESLRRRDGFSPVKSHLLWLKYSIPCLTETVGHRRLVVDYDRFLDNPRAQLARIACALNFAFDHHQAIDEYCAKFVSNSLRHSRFDTSAVRADSMIPRPIVEMHRLMQDFANDLASMDDSKSQGEVCAQETFLAATAPILVYLDSLEIGPAAGQTTRIDPAIPMDPQIALMLESRNELITDLQDQLEQQRLEAASLHSCLAAMEASTSWKMTSPLRRLVMKLRRRDGFSS